MNNVLQTIPMKFGGGFLKHYAHNLITDPRVAIVEIVSNCSDAGADLIEITWPDKNGEEFSIRDNGTGMAYDEFVNIWTELSYNRRDSGNEIIFPPGNKNSSNRKLFGKNGKGRLSLFCFADEYQVKTMKDGELCTFTIRREYERSNSPFYIELREQRSVDKSLHGTVISCKAYYNHISVDKFIELIGSKFIADASLEIKVNGQTIELTDLENATHQDVETPYGEIEIYMFDSGPPGRTSQHHGIAWHVNNKGVGKIKWRDPNRLFKVDARISEAWRYTFIVVADILADSVNTDWTGFNETEKTNIVLRIATQHIQKIMNGLFFQKREERKRKALGKNRERLTPLSQSSKNRIGEFVDELQEEVQTLEQNILNAAVGVFANLEQTRTGYTLLQQLATITPNDIDRLSDILEKWSIQDAQIVLEELGRRLNLIKKLEEVVDRDVDELHVIHPLIEQGLWIFGPEYESISYTSDRSLSNVIKNLLGDKVTTVAEPRRRPDLVVLPDSRIRIFSQYGFENSEVNGIDKVLIIELKRGGFALGKNEIRQAEDYAEVIASSGRLEANTKIICYVLGSTRRQDAQKRKIGDNDRIIIEPRTYQTVIQQAKARTFHLKEKIEKARATSNR